MPDPTPPDLDALRELAEQRLDPNGPCWNEFQRAECSERLARALLAALDDVERLDWLEANRRSVLDFGPVNGASDWRVEQEPALVHGPHGDKDNIRDAIDFAIARFKEQTDA